MLWKKMIAYCIALFLMAISMSVWITENTKAKETGTVNVDPFPNTEITEKINISAEEEAEIFSTSSDSKNVNSIEGTRYKTVSTHNDLIPSNEISKYNNPSNEENSETRSNEKQHLPEPVKIPTDPVAEPVDIEINKDRVVWADNKDGNWSRNIYTFTISTGKVTQITNDSSEGHRYPDPGEDIIVWDSRAEGSIYAKWAGPNGEFEDADDPNSDDVKVKISDASGGQRPRIHKGNIFYEADRNIYVYPLGQDEMPGTDDDGNETLLSTNGAPQRSKLAVHSNLTWDPAPHEINYYTPGPDGIYGNQDDVEVQMVNANAEQKNPDTYENKIVWRDNRNGNHDVYLFNTTTGKETQITNELTSQRRARIDENIIIYLNDGTNMSVDMYNMGPDRKPGTWDDWNKIQLTNNSQWKSNLAISNGIVIWKEGFRDVYMMNLSQIKNEQPVLDLESQLRASVGKELNLKLNASDSDDDTLTYSAEGIPENATFDDETGEFSWTPTEDDTGITYSMIFYVMDGWGGFDETAVELRANRPPTFNIIDKDHKAVPGERFHLNISGISTYGDPDNDKLNFSADTDLFNMSPDGEIDFVPGTEDWGYHKIKIKAEDGWGGEAKESINLTIDTPPKFEDFPEDQTIRTRENFHDKIIIKDPDTNKGEIEFVAGTNLTGFDIDNDTGEIDFTPEWGQEGDYKVNISIKQKSCGQTYNLERILELKIVRDNYPPEFKDLPDKLYSEVGRKSEFDINATDKDGNILTYSVKTNLTNYTMNPNTGKLSLMPENKDSGMQEIEFTVSDGTDTTTKKVEMRVNIPPNLKIKYWNNKEVGEPIYIKINNSIYLKLTSYDEDGIIKESSYKANPNIFGVDFSESSGSLNNWTPTEEHKGRHYINFSVKDNEGAQTTKMVEINVLNQSEYRELTEGSINHPPKFENLEDILYLEESKKFEFNISKFAKDEDNDILRYSAEGIPKNATFDGGTGVFSWTPAAGDVGKHSVIFGVSDGVHIDEKTITFRVNASLEEDKILPESKPTPTEDYDNNYGFYIAGAVIASIVATAIGVKRGISHYNKIRTAPLVKKKKIIRRKIKRSVKNK